MATTTASPLELSGTNVKERTMRGMIWRQFRRHRMALVGLLVLAGLVLGSVSVSVVSPYDPEKSSMRERREPPSLTHPMGTDTLGRDMMTRLFYGG
ncbi:MAG: hypothetical protein R3A10_22890, partial [Caldilineaceae bacterium]